VELLQLFQTCALVMLILVQVFLRTLDLQTSCIAGHYLDCCLRAPNPYPQSASRQLQGRCSSQSAAIALGSRRDMVSQVPRHTPYAYLALHACLSCCPRASRGVGAGHLELPAAAAFNNEQQPSVTPAALPQLQPLLPV
jgi:hypothetical protein